MDRKYIEDNEIDIKYLRNQLTPEEVEEFEVYLMENPEMVERLELDISFTTELPKNKEVLSEQEQKFLNLFSLPKIVVGLSALSILLVSSTTALFLFSRVDSGFSQIVYLSDTRSVGKQIRPIVEVVYPQKSFEYWSQDKVVFVMDAPSGANREYFLTVRQTVGDHLDSDTGQLEKITLISDQLGTITLVSDVNNYTPGEYEIEIQDETKKLTKLFRFRVTAHNIGLRK
ncbi:MAG: hypothetical protein AAF431_17010 [Pseudomonadota bacterium]